ncbi:MAG TPA: hypothetical protein VFZ09_29195 [Archangium sp.]|uniref:hypothetical protein n=1 Tax=Archangium sp. TaxID=1872627 RepID=UPI002E327A33|nr:hypothetical protein [Archangium sp.]HEX5750343.1 hypothetical protein [Archangium sp.]
MANDIKSIEIGVSVRMVDGNLCATWSFDNENADRDGTQVRLFSGQEYQVTYRLLDPASWSLDAASLRRVSDSNTGFVTLTQGETTSPQALPEGAGTVTVAAFASDALTLNVTNALSSGSEPFTVGLSLTVSARNAQGTPKQSSQDPQMILEPVIAPPSP